MRIGVRVRPDWNGRSGRDSPNGRIKEGAKSGHVHRPELGSFESRDHLAAEPFAQAKAATAKYATDLDAAKADGYRIITQMMPDMGHHFLNPSIGEEFDVTKPPILVYQRDGDDFQLGALEWVFAEKPKRKPIPGAKYGSFGAACHYDDGTFVFEDSEADCPNTNPQSGSAFVFWHPDLVTMHIWLWSPNPDGLFKGTNRLGTTFQRRADLTHSNPRGARESGLLRCHWDSIDPEG